MREMVLNKKFETFHPNQASELKELQSVGFVHFELNGEWKLSINFNDSSSSQVDKAFEAMSSAKSYSGWSCKVIGHSSFIRCVENHLRSRKIQLLKQVDRPLLFTVHFDAASAKLQVSKGELTAPQQKKIKVLIVDDSKTIRMLLKQILNGDSSIEVIGDIENPVEVESFIKRNPPDVMTLDIHMPNIDGVSLLKELAPKYNIPTIMISSISKEEGPQVLTALSYGAVDYIQKPSMKDIDLVAPMIVESVKVASQAKVQKHKAPKVRAQITVDLKSSQSLVLIGSSTGGTEALRVVFESLPSNIPPIVCVQHIPAVFSKALADRLNQLCPFEVKEAVHGDEVKANRVLIAPGGQQLKMISRAGKLFVEVNHDEPVNRHKPSVDYLFNSVVDLALKNVVGVVLTGMGADGARGLKRLRDQGARTIAQDKETSVVYGMPREAFERGGAEFVTPLEDVGLKISELCAEQGLRRAV